MTKDDSKREETDEALRAERDETDRKLEAVESAISSDADAVVQEARARADAVLADTRALADETIVDGASRSAEVHDRRRADQALEKERFVADARLGKERGASARALAALLAQERENTDERLDAEREHADVAVDSRDDFLAIVTHDLRALLNGITLSAGELLAVQCEGRVQEDVQREARRIQRFGTRMNVLVVDLLDVVSIDAGKLRVEPARHDASALIRETVETFDAAAAARGITLRGHVTDGSLLGEFDRERILQVLANLVTNAIKFTESGGAIAIHAEPAGKDVRFSVSDNGIGIDADKLTSIFDRYMQGLVYDRRGLGIGLYIARCIVEAHGGRIWVASEPDLGSVFYFTLPSAAA